MRNQIDARVFRDVPESSVAIVFEEQVPAAYRRDEEILIAVVVDAREGGGDADLSRHADAGVGRDVPEASPAQILPELVPADLVDEVDVVETVAVDVGDREAGAVIVVDRLVVAPCI